MQPTYTYTFTFADGQTLSYGSVLSVHRNVDGSFLLQMASGAEPIRVAGFVNFSVAHTGVHCPECNA